MSSLIGIGDTEPVRLRLAQALAYCATRADAADPRGSLRSDQLRPRVLEPDRARAVHAIAHLRTVYVPRNLSQVTNGDGLGGGRLLAYFPDADLSDGAAEQETDGFFDVYNAPPWDTWVALLRDESRSDRSYQEFLVSWVPPAFVALAGRGIHVNPESCIVWLDDVHAPVCSTLRSDGLLR